MAAPDAPPDLALGPLALWVHGREDLAATDEQELNRLRVTARCEGQGAEVTVTGALLTTFDLDHWLQECAALERRPEGEVCGAWFVECLVVDRSLDDRGHWWRYRELLDRSLSR